MAGKFLWSGVCAVFILCSLGSSTQAQSTGAAETPVIAPKSEQVPPPTQAGKKRILAPISVTATRNPIKSFEYTRHGNRARSRRTPDAATFHSRRYSQVRSECRILRRPREEAARYPASGVSPVPT